MTQMNVPNESGDTNEKLRTEQAWLLGFVVGAVVLALMGAAYLIGFNRGESEAPGTRVEAASEATATTEQPVSGLGKDLFVESCGGCHTLSAAGTSGTIGPDLDDLAPDDQQVLAAIANGGSGGGMMPAGLLEGEQAQQVAEFVAGSSGE
jgi:mono/diheme cytochrome c family protein